MRGDCETHRRGASGGTGVEYYSMCISLAFGSLNDAVGNIKSSVGLRALIWIVKTSAVDGNQQEGNVRNASNRKWNWSMNIWSAGEWCAQWRMISLWGFYLFFCAEISSLLSSVCKQHSESVSCTYCMYNESDVCRRTLLIFILQMRQKLTSERNFSLQTPLTDHWNVENKQIVDYWSAFRHHSLIVSTLCEADVFVPSGNGDSANSSLFFFHLFPAA